MSNKNKVDANPDGGDDEGHTGTHRGAGNAGPGGAQPDGERRHTGKTRGSSNAGPGGAGAGDDQRDAGSADNTGDPGNTGPGGARNARGAGNAGRRRSGYVVDRIEAGYAVLIAEDGGATVDEPVGHLPEDAGEGSCLLRREDGSFIVDHARTAERRAEARARLRGLRKRSRRKG